MGQIKFYGLSPHELWQTTGIRLCQVGEVTEHKLACLGMLSVMNWSCPSTASLHFGRSNNGKAQNFALLLRRESLRVVDMKRDVVCGIEPSLIVINRVACFIVSTSCDFWILNFSLALQLIDWVLRGAAGWKSFDMSDQRVNSVLIKLRYRIPSSALLLSGLIKVIKQSAALW